MLADDTPAGSARPRSADRGASSLASLEALLGPQRSALLLLLDTPKTAGQIAKALHTVPGGVTHHLRGLESAGLVRRIRRGRYVIVERTARGLALLALYGGSRPGGSARTG